MNKKSFHQNILIIFLLISAGLLLPAQSSQKLVAARDLKPFQSVLVGTTKGLFRVEENTAAVSLWTGGMVKKILVHPQGYYLLTDKGILFSKDLTNWEERNQGLPVKVLKEIAEGKKQFVRQIQDLKDLEYNPSDPSMLVTATKDGVYLSRDGGLSWKNLGMPPAKTNGLKAVAAANLNNSAVVFATHGIYGVFALPLGSSGSGASQKWISLNQGLELHETTENPDEVSDILVDTISGSNRIFALQSFRERLYELDWDAKRFNLLYKGKHEFKAQDGLQRLGNIILYAQQGGLASVPLTDKNGTEIKSNRQDITTDLLTVTMKRAESLVEGKLNAAAFMASPNSDNSGTAQLSLSELWLLQEPFNVAAEKPYLQRALNREGFYMPVNHGLDQKSLGRYVQILDTKKLNMVVIDMKDDYGRLRFVPKNPEIAAKGRVFNPVDLETFVPTMKAHGAYLVARLVVFKDPELYKKEGGKYAVWDSATNGPWQGYYENTDGTRTEYDEKWVDPYSEEVWAYITNIAKELHNRGFDEIQFDYIRFPTDGINLPQASFRWRDAGMDMESAILSFLRYVRKNVDAPISIDIYGANGWYRTGARTGQEVEVLSRYVDVICPMYYPSHFEQNFLANNPPELRPYRIYYLGTLRAMSIARNQAVIRPYMQAFYMNVSYDRKYYNSEYVLRQLLGVQNAGNYGYTYWNNIGRYDEIPLPETRLTAGPALLFISTKID
ncbi:putative glycoside hydrolase [Gracilinema caldarium]|uniref:putative glycoside hydrolase n=1 Tax=Gracilinema caldarium TaxID=215591 RepID=UPI0026F30F96|nr:putative glycoside hydrolase [Gracilinema caldarium]